MTFTVKSAKAAQALSAEQRKKNNLIKKEAIERLVATHEFKEELSAGMAKDIYKEAFLQQLKLQHELELIEAKKNAAIEIEMTKLQANIALIEADDGGENE